MSNRSVCSMVVFAALLIFVSVTSDTAKTTYVPGQTAEA